MQEVAPFTYSGFIRVPYSKSYLQRAIAIATLSDGVSVISGLTMSDDVRAALSVAENLGAEVAKAPDELRILGVQRADDTAVVVNCGEAGLGTRMFAPVAATIYDEVTITGIGSILQRPMDMVIDALEQLGAHVDSNNSHLPLEVKGRLQPSEIHIDGSASSQLLTGLLIALPNLKGKSSIHVDRLTSLPYVKMTLEILKHYGVQIEHQGYETFWIEGNQYATRSEDTWYYTAEGDWSGAAFHIVGAAISGNVTLVGLNPESVQGDRAVLDAVKQAGGIVAWSGKELLVSKGALNAFEFDATDCPDLFPPLAALAACCEGTSVITGTNRLTHKESNRALTIQEELAKLGIEVRLEPNRMLITGGPVTGGSLSSRNDHRIAMMGAILATVASDPIWIENASAVGKSYPDFFNVIDSLR